MRSFEIGTCYQIEDKKDSSKFAYDRFRLVYEGKEGIHHTFREKVGKWLVTYTDTQLIGKYVKEVK